MSRTTWRDVLIFLFWHRGVMLVALRDQTLRKMNQTFQTMNVCILIPWCLAPCTLHDVVWHFELGIRISQFFLINRGPGDMIREKYLQYLENFKKILRQCHFCVCCDWFFGFFMIDINFICGHLKSHRRQYWLRISLYFSIKCKFLKLFHSELIPI